MSSVHSLNLQHFATPRTGACQASLSITSSRSLLKLMSIESVMPSISSSVIPFSHLQSFPASGSFQMSQFFTSGGLSIGVSASTSVLSMNIQDWFSLGWTGWISLHHHLYATVIFPAMCWKYYKPSRHDPCLQNNLTAWIKKEKKKKIEPQRNEAVCHLFQTKVRKFTKLPCNYLNIMSFTKKRQTFLC